MELFVCAAAFTSLTEPSRSLPTRHPVHHSPTLPRPAPALQREHGNIAAVGSFEPGIELWDMDVVDCVEPLATLGGADYAAARAAAAAGAAAEEGGEGGEGGGGKKKKKKKKSSAPQVGLQGGAAAGRPRPGRGGGWGANRLLCARALSNASHALLAPSSTRPQLIPTLPPSPPPAGAREAGEPRGCCAGPGLEQRIPQRAGLSLWCVSEPASEGREGAVTGYCQLTIAGMFSAGGQILLMLRSVRGGKGREGAEAALPVCACQTQLILSAPCLTVCPYAVCPVPCPLSCAADKTVKIWDVVTQTCQHTLTHHSSKVQAVAWNPAEAPVLLSGGYDKRACLVSEGRRKGGGLGAAVWGMASLASPRWQASPRVCNWHTWPTPHPPQQSPSPLIPPACHPAAGHAHTRPCQRAHLAGQR
jgi:hypothetical protein